MSFDGVQFDEESKISATPDSNTKGVLGRALDRFADSLIKRGIVTSVKQVEYLLIGVALISILVAVAISVMSVTPAERTLPPHLRGAQQSQ